MKTSRITGTTRGAVPTGCSCRDCAVSREWLPGPDYLLNAARIAWIVATCGAWDCNSWRGYIRRSGRSPASVAG